VEAVEPDSEAEQMRSSGFAASPTASLIFTLYITGNEAKKQTGLLLICALP